MILLESIKRLARKQITLDGLLEKYGLSGKVEILGCKHDGPRLSWTLIRILERGESCPEPLFPPGFIKEFKDLFVTPAEKKWRRAHGKRAEFKLIISGEPKSLAQIERTQKQIASHYNLAWHASG